MDQWNHLDRAIRKFQDMLRLGAGDHSMALDVLEHLALAYLHNKDRLPRFAIVDGTHPHPLLPAIVSRAVEIATSEPGGLQVMWALETWVTTPHYSLAPGTFLYGDAWYNAKFALSLAVGHSYPPMLEHTSA